MNAERLIDQRCFNHSAREAAGRCPECGRFYCRECITEHDDRVICAACLKKLIERPFTRRRGFAGMLRALQIVSGLITAWVFFHLVGQILLSLDSSFHEGTIWRRHWLDQK